MPFGLKNAPSVFQRAINCALGDLVHSYVVVYMDDVMVVAGTKDETLERLEVVLQALTKAGFSFNITKCSFLKSCVEYLGFEVKACEIRPNPRKIKALTDLPPPQSVTQLRQFIGLVSYFRQFVPQFSQLLKPLYALTSKSISFEWNPEHEQVRQRLIFILTNEPVLSIFDPLFPIELHTDASADGYEATLLHRIENKPRVIEYFSKRTSLADSRYHSHELETLTVYVSMNYFRHYLHHRQFTVYTDCNSLKASKTKAELTPRVQRWWSYMQVFKFDIDYRPGDRMAHVDFLSRNPVLEDRKN